MADRTALDYTARDFEAIRSMLVGIAQGSIPEWRTVGEPNDFGTLLIELYAYMGDVMNFYIDRVASEAFLGTAQLRQSVMYMAEMLGYKPLGQRAAIVPLVFTATDPSGGDITIPAGTRVETNEDASSAGDLATPPVVFETDYTVVIPLSTGVNSVTVTATEGTTKSVYLGSGNGVPLASYRLEDKGVIQGTVSIYTLEGTSTASGAATSPVFVDWKEVDSVATSRATQSVFSTYLDDSGYTYVTFGDNSSGRIPPMGCEIRAKYRYGVGSRANSVMPDQLTVLGTGTNLSGVTVSNLDIPTGGSDVESVDSMRYSIPRSRQVSNRGVTLRDIESLALQVPGVGKAVAYGEVYSSVNLRIAPISLGTGSEKMASIRKHTTDYLEERTLLGTRVYVEDAEWLDVFIKIDIYVLSGFSREATEASVQSAVTSLFDYSILGFGDGVSLGAVYRAVMGVSGVDFAEVRAFNSTSADDGTTSMLISPKFNQILRIKEPELPLDYAGDDVGTYPSSAFESGLKLFVSGGFSSGD